MIKLASNYIVDILNKQMSMPAGSVWLRDQNAKIPNDTGLYISVGLVSSFPMAAESYMRQTSSTDWDEEQGAWDVDGQFYDVTGVPVAYDDGTSTWDTAGQKYDQQNVLQVEVNEMQAREMIQIDIFSRSTSALLRNWEVIAALNSFYSQQTQEANSFKIFRLPQNFTNTSSAEGSSFINRYTITFPCFVWYRKEKVLPSYDYYDKFGLKAYDYLSIAGLGLLTNYDKDGSDETWDQPGQTFDVILPLLQFEIDQEGIKP